LTLVVDASAATLLCLAEDGFALAGVHLIAPVLLRSETLSALQGMRWRQEITGELAEQAIERLLAAPIRLVRRNGIYREALRIAAGLGWAKTYDAEYIGLALVEGVPLMTIDARLVRRVKDLVETRLPESL
jgi:predicted nucleic acid-binding protein